MYLVFNSANSSIKTTTFNCHGFKSSIPDICNLCLNNDIIFLQELWLAHDEIQLLRNVHPDFDSMGVSGMDLSAGIVHGRPFGGVGILIRRNFLPHAHFRTYDDNRLISVEINTGTDILFFLNVYMPYQCEENLDVYVEYLGKLTAIVESAPTSKLAIVGDFNASSNSRFEKELNFMCEQYNLIISDHEICGRNSGCYTYVSDVHLSTSWLDHYICSHDMHSLVSNVRILDKLPSSDHLPIEAEFETVLQHSPAPATPSDQPKEPVFNWSKASKADISAYSEETMRALSEINLPEVIMCNDMQCKLAEHKSQLDTLYLDICSALRRSSEAHIASSNVKDCRDFVVPGFNGIVKDLHSEARNAYIIWRSQGRPRQGPLCELMRRTRLNFKYALRQCQRTEDTARADAMANSLANNDSASFWKHTKAKRNRSVPLASNVDGYVGNRDIANMWQQHYSALLNSVSNPAKRTEVNDLINSGQGLCALAISPAQVSDSMKALKLGKSCGSDGIAAEHFKFANKSICVYLSILFTSFLVHGYLPANFMKSALVPIVKNKSGNTSDKSNYRPIALVTLCSKLFEVVLLRLIDPFLKTCDNQFGFKADHSTDLCIFTLKSTIQYYRDNNSPVFTCFLDASKAFDRVNHWLLFDKLITRGVPMIIVRILKFWYQHQLLCIKWGNATSEYFNVSNGVRQGGILSPRLFSLYVDELSVILEKCNSGCHIDSICMNHLFYADDLCLLAPSPSGLQSLLDVCAKYGCENDIVFNHLKSICIVFKPKAYKLHCPHVSLGDINLKYTDSNKYLGFSFNETFSDDIDIARQMRLLYTRSNIFLREFAHCSLHVKGYLFKMYCVTFYCPFLWVNFKKQSIDNLRVAFNKVHRKLLNYGRRDSASEMFVTNNMQNFDSMLRKSIYGFIERLKRSKNKLVSALFNCLSLRCGAMWSFWHDRLHLFLTA